MAWTRRVNSRAWGSPSQAEKSIDWYWPNPSGGGVSSSVIGVRWPRSRPSVASSRTQSLSTEFCDQATITASA